MMKPIFSLITVFCCLAFHNAYCQNDYHNIENFKEGTTLVFQSCETDNVETGKSGKNIIWDFSNLKHTKDTITQWISTPHSINEANDYPQATLVEKYSDGSYVFLKTEENKTYLLGFIDEKSQVKINYPQPVLIAKRPFSYNETVTKPYTTSYTVNELSFSGKGTATIEADGFGTLILPNNTYENTLRIKITLKQSDVLKQYNSTTETTITTYAWFDQKHSSALLKMTETKSQYHSDKSIEYLLNETVK